MLLVWLMLFKICQISKIPALQQRDYSVVITPRRYGERRRVQGSTATSPVPRAFISLANNRRSTNRPMAFLSASEKDEPTWHDFANCLGVDPDLFFPERGASTKEAKEVCRGCVVRDDCLEYALQNGEKFGIWGGMSERERRRIRRQRALARAAAAAESSG